MLIVRAGKEQLLLPGASTEEDGDVAISILCPQLTRVGRD